MSFIDRENALRQIRSFGKVRKKDVDQKKYSNHSKRLMITVLFSN